MCVCSILHPPCIYCREPRVRSCQSSANQRCEPMRRCHVAKLKAVGPTGRSADQVLTAIISCFDHQLLENKSSFTLCSICIIFSSNKFHKFWMSFDFRRTHAKKGQNWVESQADRPILGRPAWHPYTSSHDFDPGAMSCTQMPLSRGLNVGLFECTGRLAQGSKAPPFSAKTCPS